MQYNTMLYNTIQYNMVKQNTSITPASYRQSRHSVNIECYG